MSPLGVMNRSELIDWSDLLTSQGGHFLIFMALLAVLGLASMGMAAWQQSLNARLKEKMIERGFTPEEIISVINAKPQDGRPRKPAPPGPASTARSNHSTTATS